MTDTSDKLPPTDWKRSLVADYPEAVVRLATLRADKRQHLIFGWVELYPIDTQAPASWKSGDRPWPVPTTADWTCAFSATRTTTLRALEWYEGLAQGSLALAVDQPTSKKHKIGPLGPEPVFGRYNVHVEAPFVFRWHDCPRVHRLVPLAPPPAPVRRLRNIPAARTWLNRQLSGFDPYDTDEWLAGAALVAPNPLCASVGLILGPRGNDGSECIVVQLTPRRSRAHGVASLASLTMHVGEKRADGWSDFISAPVPESGQFLVPLPQPIAQVASALVCRERGILRLLEPHSWVRQTSVHSSVATSNVTVEVPAGGRRKPASEYVVTRYTPTTSFNIGALADDTVQRILRRRRARRVERETRKAADQKLLGLTVPKETASPTEIAVKRNEAKDFVINLIAKARRRVMIVDPFFDHRDFREFALRATSAEVSVRILTSWEVQNKKASNAGASSTSSSVNKTTKLRRVIGFVSKLARRFTNRPTTILNGHVFSADMATIAAQIGTQVAQVRIMPGKSKSVIHDRFLVIDRDVWLLGPSFNELGERLGVATKLADPLSVRLHLREIWHRSTPLERFDRERADAA